MPKSGNPCVILPLEKWYCMEPYSAGPLEIVFDIVLKRPEQNNTHIIAPRYCYEVVVQILYVPNVC